MVGMKGGGKFEVAGYFGENGLGSGANPPTSALARSIPRATRGFSISISTTIQSA